MTQASSPPVVFSSRDAVKVLADGFFLGAQSASSSPVLPAGPARAPSGRGRGSTVSAGRAGALGRAAAVVAAGEACGAAAGGAGAAVGLDDAGAVECVGAGVAAAAGVVAAGVVVAGADGSTAGAGSAATWVGACATGSPGTPGCCPPAPTRLPLSAMATMPAVHSALAIRFRLGLPVLPCD